MRKITKKLVKKRLVIFVEKIIKTETVLNFERYVYMCDDLSQQCIVFV